MKITLRKVRSNPIDAEYTTDLFVPLALEPFKSAVSLTVNDYSSQYYNIIEKYGLDLDRRLSNQTHIVRAGKKVVTVRDGDLRVIMVPPTFASNTNNIVIYTQMVCVSIFWRSIKYLHFTHFGFLKNKFPKFQIQKILEEFSQAKHIDCEICWDIDEKFFTEMQSLIEIFTAAKDNKEIIEYYDERDFLWSEEYKNLRAERDIAQGEMLRFRNNIRRGRMVTIANRLNMHIAPGATGSAGEFYALSLFIRMGFIAGKAPEGTANYDLIVMSPNALSFAPVQVKTVTNSTHWMLTQRHENVISNLIFCFVLFSSEITNTRVFLVPASVVSNAIRTGNEIYLRLPNRQGGQRVGGSMRTLEIDYSILTNTVPNPSHYLTRTHSEFLERHSLGWLDRYENNFDILNSMG